MTQFEYLSVLISIIIGLAITQLLSGAARLIQIRKRARPHPTTLCWMVILFLIDAQIWWAAFGMRRVEGWNFFLFMFYLLVPILAFLLSYLVLPELGDEDEIDLAANFAGNRPWFFGLLSGIPLLSLLNEYLALGAVDWNADAVFRVVLAAIALLAACVTSARFHLWNALFALAMLCAYVGTLFLHLH
jgi:hypothetical protein